MMSATYLRRALLASAAASASLAFSGAAIAQSSNAGIVPPASPATPPAAATEPASTPAVQTQTNSAQLGDIVVTARKRGESILQVPVAITALTAQGLAARGIRDLNGLNDFVPGLRYENSAANRNDRSFTTITMRGMYPGDSPNRPGAGVFLDGVSIPGGTLPGLTDIERVEVVKGPQSAYFGRATFAGAINFITAAPSLTEFKGNLSGSYESYGTTEDSVSIEGPIITDRLAIRLTGRHYHTDGQYKNEGYGGRLGERETNSFGASIIAKPIDALTIRGYYSRWKDDDGPSAQGVLTEADYNCNAGGNGRAVNGLNYVCGGIGNINSAMLSQNTISGNNGNFTQLTNSGHGVLPADYLTHLGLRRNEYQANSTATLDLGNYTVAGSVGKNRNDWAIITDTYDRAPDGHNYYSSVYLPYHIKNVSSELRVSTNGTGPFKAMLGGNYYHESIFFEGRALRPNAAGVPTITQLSQPTDYLATTYGIFGSASYDFTRKLTLSTEGRYQWDTIHHHIYTVGGFDQQKTFGSFNPRVILNYKITPLISLYTSFAKGTRPGTFNSNLTSFTAAQQAQLVANAGGSIPTAVPEETLKTYEVGVKGEFFDRRLRVLADGYYGQWRHRQINQNIAYTTASNTTSTATFTFPNGSTDLWGIEAEATLKITRDLTFDSTFNWAHTKVLYTVCAECVAINGVSDPVGNSMERYPEFSGTAGISYSHPVFGDWNGTARLDYIYTGKQYATEANVAYLKAANRFNMNIGVENAKYRLEFFGRNIFNNKVPSNILRNANPFSGVSEGANLIVLAAPEKASFGVRGSVKF